jgi:phenylpyruvate tautomerase PptA (4-oxalocrotonate tautomerase family)
MPTYYVSVKTDLLSQQQKDDVCQLITTTHNKVTGASNSLVQVIIDESIKTRYLGGKRSDAHIWIRGDIRAGRSADHRQRLMLDIMRGVSKISGVEESLIWVYLNNLSPEDMVEYGRVLPPPGKESEWFALLPQEVQAYLIRWG